MFFAANNGQLTDWVRKALWVAGKGSGCFKAFGAVSFTFAFVAILSGCSFKSQGDALREAVNSGQIEGITSKDGPDLSFLYTYPDRHEGEFSRVDIFNVSVYKSDGKGENWSVVMGLNRVDDKWKVIRVAKQTGPKKWEEIPLVPVVPTENTIQP